MWNSRHYVYIKYQIWKRNTKALILWGLNLSEDNVGFWGLIGIHSPQQDSRLWFLTAQGYRLNSGEITHRASNFLSRWSRVDICFSQSQCVCTVCRALPTREVKQAVAFRVLLGIGHVAAAARLCGWLSSPVPPEAELTLGGPRLPSYIPLWAWTTWPGWRPRPKEPGPSGLAEALSAQRHFYQAEHSKVTQGSEAETKL